MSPTENTPNILIISDLHLGEDIKPHGDGESHHIQLLERELESFLAHYTVERIDGRPWHLIVNGDMVDFLSVCLLPKDGDHDAETLAELSDEDHVYGLGARPHQARAKMRSVLQRHHGVFGALARFLGAGNEVGIVAGNHDAEFHWPLVQETLRAGVAAAWAADAASQAPDALAATDVADAIQFHPWFYYQDGLVWVEHGHQYDDYCSFDYQLHPVTPGGEIVPNVGAVGIRYVGNHFTKMVQGMELMGAWGYLVWSLRQGLRRTWAIAKAYFMMVFSLLVVWRSLFRRPEAAARIRLQHEARVREVAAQFRLEPTTIEALHMLRARPAASSLFGVFLAIMFDRVIVTAIAVLAAVAVVFSLPGLAAMGALVGIVVVAWLASQVLARFRVNTDPDPALRTIPERILRHVKARFVVFGHSHEAAEVALPGGSTYYNTGTWLPAGKVGLVRAFTHLLIRHGQEGPRASLCQWRDGRSQEFRPDPA